MKELIDNIINDFTPSLYNSDLDEKNILGNLQNILESRLEQTGLFKLKKE